MIKYISSNTKIIKSISLIIVILTTIVISILIVNMLAPCIDHFMRGRKNTYTWKQCLGLGVAIIIAACIISASVVGGWF